MVRVDPLRNWREPPVSEMHLGRVGCCGCGRVLTRAYDAPLCVEKVEKGDRWFDCAQDSVAVPFPRGGNGCGVVNLFEAFQSDPGRVDC